MGLARRNLMKETVSCSFEKCSQYLTDRAIQLNARFDRRIAQPLVMSSTDKYAHAESNTLLLTSLNSAAPMLECRKSAHQPQTTRC